MGVQPNPQAMLFDMCVGDAMVEMMRQWNNPKFKASDYWIEISQQRLRKLMEGRDA